MRKALAALAILAGLIAGCAPLPSASDVEPVEQVPAIFPCEHYLAASAHGEPVFRSTPHVPSP